MLDSILKVFRIWNNFDDISSVGEMVMKQATLEVSDAQIEMAVSKYIKNRGDSSIVADVKRIEQFLVSQTTSPISGTDFVSTDYGAKNMVKARQALYARELLLKLWYLQAMDHLPSTSPKPWRERRNSLTRLRQGMATMTLQFEAVVRRKTKELKNTREFQGRIMAIALGGDVTDADLKVIEEDMREQDADAAAATAIMNKFAMLANMTHKTVKNIDRVIEAGDKRERLRTR